MSAIETYIELDTKRRALREEIRPTEKRISDLTALINNAWDKISYKEKDFICDKLWDTFDEKHKDEVIKVRKDREDMLSGDGSYVSYALTNGNAPFDPYYDKWEVFDFEKNDEGKIRIEVSCLRREGNISGFMRMIDIYWTDWFDLSEIPA